MLSKPRKAKAVSTRRAPARKTDSKRKTLKLAPELPHEEVVAISAQLERHAQSERAWQKLSSPDEGEDGWSAVEEHLLAKSHQHQHAERRWKYFAK